MNATNFQRSRMLAAAFTLLGALLLLLAPSPPSARAAAPLLLGTADNNYVAATGERQQKLFNETKNVGAGIVRLNAFWFRIAPERPLIPEDPGSPGYRFGPLDAAVREASRRGLDVILTLQRAPRWAEGPNRPPIAHQGTWDPDPVAFGDFAKAVATRYSGHYFDPLHPTEPSPPRVRLYQAWNEPNLQGYLTPQYTSGPNSSVEIYRDLLDQAYANINAVDASNVVAAAGTAPLDSKAGERVGPETFWRKLLCLTSSLKKASCRKPASFDVLDHHPITPKDPRVRGEGDSVRIVDYPVLTKMLRAAERLHTIQPAGLTRPLWASEIYWETNPPDPKSGLRPRQAALYLEQGLHLLYRRNVRMILNFFMADTPLVIAGDPGETQGGLLYNDLRRKPSFTAFRFPFVSQRVSRRKVSVWGRSPAPGRLSIERKVKRRWKPIKTLRVKSGAVFTARLRLDGKAQLRARVGKSKSLTYRQK